MPAYRVQVRRFLRGSEAESNLHRVRALVVDGEEEILRTDTDYIFQGRLIDKTLFVSRHGLYRHTSELESHIASSSLCWASCEVTKDILQHRTCSREKHTFSVSTLKLTEPFGRHRIRSVHKFRFINISITLQNDVNFSLFCVLHSLCSCVLPKLYMKYLLQTHSLCAHVLINLLYYVCTMLNALTIVRTL